MKQEFYEEKSWGSMRIKEGKDLPTLKLRRLLHALPEEGKVLEIGSGSGRILASVQHARPTLKLTGVDISKKQVALAKRDNKGITFKVGNAEKLPFKDRTFDAVFFLDVIEHVEHPRKVMSECARVLKNGGTFHFFSPCEAHGIYKLSHVLLGWHIKEKTAGHIQQYVIKDLEKMTEKHFRIVKREYSYHILGSVMDFTMFALLLNKKIAKLFWAKNKYYRNKQTKQSLFSKLFNVILSFTNAIAYCESTLFRTDRLTATAVHITARKP